MPASAHGPRQILVIRHGEKPGTSAPGHQSTASGVQENGTTNPHCLTPRGWQRAGALAVLLGPSGRLNGYRPGHLFAPDYGAQNPDHRTVETLQPMAELLALPIATPCTHDAVHDLVHHHVVAAADSVVLICWDHRNIPDLVHELASALTISPPASWPDAGWPDDRYDVILSFTRTEESNSYRYEQLPQLLLSGDSAAPLGE